VKNSPKHLGYTSSNPIREGVPNEILARPLNFGNDIAVVYFLGDEKES
jgi:hypothetical protein